MKSLGIYFLFVVVVHLFTSVQGGPWVQNIFYLHMLVFCQESETGLGQLK